MTANAIDGEIVAKGVPVVDAKSVAIGSKHRALIVDMVGETRLACAIRALFLVGYDTVDIAQITRRSEPEVVALLNQAPWPARIEVFS